MIINFFKKVRKPLEFHRIDGIFIGDTMLSCNTYGINNIGVGYEEIMRNNNIGVGYEVLYSNNNCCSRN